MSFFKPALISLIGLLAAACGNPAERTAPFLDQVDTLIEELAIEKAASIDPQDHAIERGVILWFATGSFIEHGFVDGSDFWVRTTGTTAGWCDYDDSGCSPREQSNFSTEESEVFASYPWSNVRVIAYVMNELIEERSTNLLGECVSGCVGVHRLDGSFRRYRTRVWLIDIKQRQVIAFRQFDPPTELTGVTYPSKGAVYTRTGFPAAVSWIRTLKQYP